MHFLAVLFLVFVVKKRKRWESRISKFGATEEFGKMPPQHKMNISKMCVQRRLKITLHNISPWKNLGKSGKMRIKREPILPMQKSPDARWWVQSKNDHRKSMTNESQAWKRIWELNSPIFSRKHYCTLYIQDVDKTISWKCVTHLWSQRKTLWRALVLKWWRKISSPWGQPCTRFFQVRTDLSRHFILPSSMSSLLSSLEFVWNSAFTLYNLRIWARPHAVKVDETKLKML